MISTEVEFTMKFKVTLDGVPGWGHDVEDWRKLAASAILMQTHYNPSASNVGEPIYSETCHSQHAECIEAIESRKALLERLQATSES